MAWIEQMSPVSSTELEEHRLSMFLIVTFTLGVLLLMTLMAITRFSFRTYFLLLFVGFLISSEVFAPVNPETDWWRWLQIIKAIGWVIFGYIIFGRVAPFF